MTRPQMPAFDRLKMATGLAEEAQRECSECIRKAPTLRGLYQVHSLLGVLLEQVQEALSIAEQKQV